MEAALKQLTKKMPPPSSPRENHVDWTRLEKAVGLPYPESYKQFIEVYGAAVWFDNLSPFYTEAKSDDEAKKFVKAAKKKLEPLKTNMYDESFNPIEIPLYPATGGLFPFLIDYSSNLFCWQTSSDASDEWPIAFWNRGPVVMLEMMTISKMILHWLQRKPQMIRVWGDVKQLDPARIRLD